MKKYLKEYISYLENNLDKESKEEILIKIHNFQHERLIHLIVTIVYAFLFLAFFLLVIVSWIFLIPVLILMVFLIFYIIHYFTLENGVIYLYKLYDKKVCERKFDKM